MGGGREGEQGTLDCTCHCSRDYGFKVRLHVRPPRPPGAQGSKLVSRPASGLRLASAAVGKWVCLGRVLGTQVSLLAGSRGLSLLLLPGLGLRAEQQLSRREPEFVE